MIHSFFQQRLMRSFETYYISLFFLSTVTLFSKETSPTSNSNYSYIEKKKFKQWFTGPVLTPTPITLPPGHPGLEVALVALNTYGFYDDSWRLKNTSDIWSIGPFVDFMAGITNWLGVEILGSYATNFNKGNHFSDFNDIRGRVGFQILTDQPGTWIPDFRILFQETFPTGNYDKLNPKHPEIEITGEGSFQSGLHFAFQKLFESNLHPLRIRWSIGYFIPASFSLKGINRYGGAIDTNGKMRLGNLLVIFFSGEYSLSKTWSLAWESNFRYRRKNNFSGNAGFLAPNVPAEIDTSSFYQISLAPEIEHTFNANTGMLIGSWFTLAGKNSPAFAAVFISFLHVF